MSKELRDFLVAKGIATSRTTPYNPQGNGQVERYNGIIWKAVILALKTQGLETKHWQYVLPDALHSIRTLLCTATNATPHERLFNYARRSTNGVSLPSWLMNPGSVLLKRHVRVRKDEPLVDMVELIQANPDYAHIRYADGRESTVSTRHLAPLGDDQSSAETVDQSSTADQQAVTEQSEATDSAPSASENCDFHDAGETPVRRSERVRRAPIRYGIDN